MDNSAATAARIRIPLIDTGGEGPLALIGADPDRFRRVIAMGEKRYGNLGLSLGDRFSRRWLARTENPYAGEITTVTERARESGMGPGAYLLNLSYEWACTSGVGADPDGGGSRLLRTLDWPLDGLGRLAVVARRTTNAGTYCNITWPGFVGVATAMAPARFSAALNQPPMPRYTPSCWLDWGLERLKLRARRGLPPVHLLRRVFDTCRTYDEARAMLMETPLCIPAFFSLSGAETGQGCIVERREDEAAVREAPASITNHWLGFDLAARSRGEDSPGRLEMMNRLRDGAANDFSWVAPPILNPTTRLAVIANAATGRLKVQGFEADGPVTEVFSL